MTSHRNSTTERRFGLPAIGIIGLAAVAAPRVVLHDLGIIEEGTLINSLFVFFPMVIWIATVLLLRVRKPFLSLLAVGLVYGVFLAAGHLLLWNQAFPNGPPQLGGNLGGMDPVLQAVLFRVFTALSSLMTGAVAGAVTGLIATGLSGLLRLRRRKGVSP